VGLLAERLRPPHLSAGQLYMSQNTKPVYCLYDEELGLYVSVAYAVQRTLKLAVYNEDQLSDLICHRTYFTNSWMLTGYE